MDEKIYGQCLELHQDDIDAVPNVRNSWDKYSHFYLVNLDTLELVIARVHHRIRKLQLALHEDLLPHKWEEALKNKTPEVRAAVLPIPRLVVETLINALRERGYQFIRWLPQRSHNNLIGEFTDSKRQKPRMVKCFYLFERHQDIFAWNPFPPTISREGLREIEVARHLLQEGNCNRNIVRIFDVFAGADNEAAYFHPLYAVVMKKAVNDLSSLSHQNTFFFDPTSVAAKEGTQAKGDDDDEAAGADDDDEDEGPGKKQTRRQTRRRSWLEEP